MCVYILQFETSKCQKNCTFSTDSASTIHGNAAITIKRIIFYFSLPLSLARSLCHSLRRPFHFRFIFLFVILRLFFHFEFHFVWFRYVFFSRNILPTASPSRSLYKCLYTLYILHLLLNIIWPIHIASEATAFFPKKTKIIHFNNSI